MAKDPYREIILAYKEKEDKAVAKYREALKKLGPKPPEPFGAFPSVAARTRAALKAVAYSDKVDKLERDLRETRRDLEDQKAAKLQALRQKEARAFRASSGRGASSGSLTPF